MNFESRFVSDAPALELREVDGKRMFRGGFAVFNSRSHDLGGFREVIDPKAFNRVLARGDDVQAWFNHNPDNLLAATRSGTLRLWTDERAAWYEFPYDDSDPDHQRIAAKIARGDLAGSSFGFRAATDEWSTDDDDYPLRTVTEMAAVRDVGPVSMPAYPETETVGAMTFRSLAELTELPADELVKAAKAGTLRDTLISLHAEGEAQEDSDADSQKDADSDAETRIHVPPLPPASRHEWADYTKGQPHGNS
jgi:hypothetical protein